MYISPLGADFKIFYFTIFGVTKKITGFVFFVCA